MSNENLRWAAPEEIVRFAYENGFTTQQIVRIVSGCLPYREARQVAREYAPLLGITTHEFMALRRNE